MRAEVIVPADHIEFHTRTNGDKISIRNIHFDANNAAKLATLINSSNDLKMIIKDQQG